MTLNFLQLPPEGRRLYVDQAAANRDISPVVVEKDFWVCWLLGILVRIQIGLHPCRIDSCPGRQMRKGLTANCRESFFFSQRESDSSAGQ